jgi:hypothetical protein
MTKWERLYNWGFEQGRAGGIAALATNPGLTITLDQLKGFAAQIHFGMRAEIPAGDSYAGNASFQGVRSGILAAGIRVV